MAKLKKIRKPLMAKPSKADRNVMAEIRRLRREGVIRRVGYDLEIPYSRRGTIRVIQSTGE